MEIETKAVHSGYKPDPTTNAVAVPIYQTTAYAFDNTQHGADLFNLAVLGNIYSRIMNPTNDVLEQRIADMEGGVAGLALASGQAATTYAIQTISEAGDNFISMSTLYGGTYNLFAHTFPQMGINVRFVDPENLDAMAALIDDKTKAVYCESLGNPAGNILDIEKVAEIAHAHGIPLIVDNTVPSPYLCRPIEWGADIVVHSLTKYIGGHGTIIGGIIVDSNKFDWVANKDRFKRLNEPDVSYHGVVYTETGLPPYILRARVVPLRNMGAALAPMNSFLALQGLETLPLRMDRICENALIVAKHLEGHSQVEWVRYAGLESSPHKALGQVPGWQGFRDIIVWYQGRDRGRHQVHRRFTTDHAIGEHWRRQVTGLSSCIDHPSPVRGGGTGCFGGISRHGTLVDRYREYKGYYC